MTEMINFSIALLEAVSDWLSTPPILYLFALALFAFVFKIVLMLLGKYR